MRSKFVIEMIKSFATRTTLIIRSICSLIFTHRSQILILHCLSFMTVSFLSTSAFICSFLFKGSLSLNLISGLDFNMFSIASTRSSFLLRNSLYARSQRLWRDLTWGDLACDKAQSSLRLKLIDYIPSNVFWAHLYRHWPNLTWMRRQMTRLSKNLQYCRLLTFLFCSIMMDEAFRQDK